jgi:hypothetical protein
MEAGSFHQIIWSNWKFLYFSIGDAAMLSFGLPNRFSPELRLATCQIYI